MPATGDRSLENLIRGSEDLIRDLEPGSAIPREPVDGDLGSQVAVPLEALAVSSTDGEVHITVSKDEMFVHASFHPPSGDGQPLFFETVQAAVEAARIAAGVDWEAVKGCILTCNEERADVLDIVIARGIKPLDEIPPYLVLSERLVSRAKKDEALGARVDFKELSLFTLVKKGEELALLMPKQDGAMGATVRGNAVAFGKQRIPFPRSRARTPHGTAGGWSPSATASSRSRRRASGWTRSWTFSETSTCASATSTFPAMWSSGEKIRDGFTVKAGKSILCTGCIGAARMKYAGDLVTQQGIVGKEKAVIRVGGAAEAKFLEGCALDADGPVRVRTSILNSTIHTKDKVEMGERGIIIGGIVKAQNGVLAAQIGTERGPRTEIHCGVDFKVEQKLVWIRDRNIALAFKLREIEAKMKAGAKEREVLVPLREKIKAAIHQLNENARSIVSGLDKNESAEISVRGNVYPGTYIEICHVSHFVTKPKRFLTFHLEKALGKIVETKWEKSAAQPSSQPPAMRSVAQKASRP